VGEDYNVCVKELQSNDIYVNIDHQEYSNSVPMGSIISQDKTGEFEKGTAVNVVVSNGPEPTTSDIWGQG